MAAQSENILSVDLYQNEFSHPCNISIYFISDKTVDMNITVGTILIIYLNFIISYLPDWWLRQGWSWSIFLSFSVLASVKICNTNTITVINFMIFHFWIILVIFLCKHKKLKQIQQMLKNQRKSNSIAIGTWLCIFTSKICPE